MDQIAFAADFRAIFEKNGLGSFVTEEHILLFSLLTERMLTVNERMNLTAITEQRAVILRHYADSLTVAPYLPDGARVLDVGCGAGFPSLPLAIVRPDLRLTALDSTAKRIDYVADTAKLLGLSNLHAVAARAEDGAAAGQPGREHYDRVLSRAVANLPVLCELCLPYTRVGGTFIAMKAQHAAEETQAALHAIEELGGGRVKSVPLTLSDGVEPEEERTLILVEKIGKTPKNYPRNFAQIKKKPL